MIDDMMNMMHGDHEDYDDDMDFDMAEYCPPEENALGC
jgi:hypothetical protein